MGARDDLRQGAGAIVTPEGGRNAARTAWSGALRAVVDNSPLPTCVFDEHGIVRLWNRECERLLGAAADQQVGSPLTGDAAPWFDHCREQVLAGASVNDRPVRWGFTDGTHLDLEVSMSAVRPDGHDAHGVLAYIVDVTQRRQTEEALRRSEERFRVLVQESADLVLVFSNTGEVTYVSPSAVRFLGRSQDALTGMKPTQLVDPTDADQVRAFLIAPPEPGQSVGPEVVRVPRADGQARWLEVMVTNLLDDPTVMGIVAEARDVTERVETARALEQANVALGQSNEALRAVVNNSPNAIVAFDDEFKIWLWNPAAERLFGLAAHAVMDREHGLRGLFVGERAERFFDRLDRGESVDHVELVTRRADGDEILLSVSVALMGASDHASGSMLAVMTDVTDRRRAEEAVRASERRFRHLVSGTSDVIAVVESDGTLRYASPALERVLGYLPETVAGTLVLDAVHDDDRWKLEGPQVLSSSLRTATPFEVRVRHADGSWRVMEVVASDLRDDPAVAGYAVTLRDVTERNQAADELYASEARYRAIVSDQTELICRYTSAGVLTFVNEAFAHAFGTTTGYLQGRALKDFFGPDRISELNELTDRVQNPNGESTLEYEILLPDGTLRWFAWTHHPVLDERGEITEIQAVGRDVTEQRRAEKLLSEQARVLELIARSHSEEEVLSACCRIVETQAPGSQAVVLLAERDGARLRVAAAPSVNDAIRSDLDGMECTADSPPPGLAVFRGSDIVVEDLRNDAGGWTRIESVPRSGVQSCWSVPIHDTSGRRVVGTLLVLRDQRGEFSGTVRQTIELAVSLVSIALERSAFENRLAHQAHHDPLTGLPNRLLFLEFLEHALARSRRGRTSCAVLFLDLDRFKNVNDSLGHNVGDDLLISVAERLRGALRPEDTIARFGGDEFVILCEDLSPADAYSQAIDVAERLLDAVHAPFALVGDEAFIGGSIGIAVASSQHDDAEALVRDADAAMYQAKARGKGRWELFDEQMRATAVARLEIENSLHHACERGEFRVFYQPIVSLTEARVIGAEALVRWLHPERGLIAPDAFIEVAEETGLIVPIGSFVLDEVCREVKALESSVADPFFVSVNLSARQLMQPDLVERVAESLRRSGANPARVGLEITESVLMDDIESGIGEIHALRDLGVHISIDDFGTGYSSLGYLKRLPVDSVKIDRSFVDGLGTEGEDSAIVTAVVSLGHALGLQVVAEGVETERHVRELVRLGCDQAQGFYFAPPQPVEDLRALVAANRPWRPPGKAIMLNGS